MKSLNSPWFYFILWITIFGLFLFVFSLEMGFYYGAIRAGYIVTWLVSLFFLTLPLVRKCLVPGEYLKFTVLACIVILLISALKGLAETHLMPEEAKFLLLREQQPRPIFYFLSSVSAFLLFTLIWHNKFLKEAEKRSLLSQKLQTETQLNLLQAQIQPHSLFNTINNIYALVIEQREEAGEAILKLSEMLRYAVYKKDDSMEVSISEEAKQIDTLIWLYQIKEDNRFDISFHKQIFGGKILPMLLIPLVENALKYCDFNSNPEASIQIILNSNAQDILFTIKNTYSPTTTSNLLGGVGLSNVKKRLELFYPGKHTFETKSRNKLFEVKLELWNKSDALQ
ncbi:sensor histidine kinase [Aquiflexum sp.]|uniref:sensor histidine kinase n=1 Tax=Aquiflexum sp. TaxID=1872584 RepID=UPI00359403A4